MQSNVLAQCSTALLVAASATWIRRSEARYRQVVTHIPVVLYSAEWATVCLNSFLYFHRRAGSRLLAVGTPPREVGTGRTDHFRESCRAHFTG